MATLWCERAVVGAESNPLQCETKRKNKKKQEIGLYCMQVHQQEV